MFLESGVVLPFSYVLQRGGGVALCCVSQGFSKVWGGYGVFMLASVGLLGGCCSVDALRGLSGMSLRVLHALRRGTQLAAGRLTTQMDLSSAPIFRHLGQLRGKKCVGGCVTMLSTRGLGRNFIMFYDIGLEELGQSVTTRFAQVVRSVPRMARYCGVSNDCSCLLGVRSPGVGCCRRFVLGILNAVSDLNSLRDAFMVGRMGRRCKVRVWMGPVRPLSSVPFFALGVRMSGYC